MRVINKPNKSDWKELVQRPGIEQKTLESSVREILDDVKRNRDNALYRYTKLLDGVVLEKLRVEQSEIDSATLKVSAELKLAIEVARQNIETFHKSQYEKPTMVETSKGVKCWRKNVGIERVGLYIPGGSAPLFSTILMLAIPAKIAGCREIILCTPPDKHGDINPVILYVAQLVGVTEVYKVGGAQAVGAMAYGTESITAVNKIFGPGNQFVTTAKQLVQQSGVAIDLPAGPSELLVIADKTGVPEFIAADLLSQAEHGADSQVILISNCDEIIEETLKCAQKQLENLPRKETAGKALKNSTAIVLDSIEECVDFSNAYAPEHLIIASESPEKYVESILNAGSVFLGNYSCESAGDYASGTNHTPSNKWLRPKL